MSDDIFLFKSLSTFRSSSANHCKYLRYNAIDSSSGILISLSDNELYFYRIKDLEVVSLNSHNQVCNPDNLSPFLKYRNEAYVSWVQFNCSGSLLLVALVSEDYNLMGIKIVDMEKTIIEGREVVYCQFKPHTVGNLLDVKWHPNESGYFLMNLNDVVSLCCIKNNELIIIGEKSNAFCVSWSPKGKQFSVVMRNEATNEFIINQYDISMEEKKTTQLPNMKNSFEASCELVPVDLCWYSTFYFIIGFRGDTQDGDQYRIYTCSFGIKTQSFQPLHETASSSGCFPGASGPLARLYYEHIPEWSVIVFINNTSEQLVVYEYDVNFQVKCLNSYCLPVDGNVIGMSCDFTSVATLPPQMLSSYKGQQKTGFPILLVKMSNSECFGLYLLHSLKNFDRCLSSTSSENTVVKSELSISTATSIISSEASTEDSILKKPETSSIFGNKLITSENQSGGLFKNPVVGNLENSNKINISSESKATGNLPVTNIFGLSNANNQSSFNFGLNTASSETSSNLFSNTKPDSETKGSPKVDLFGTKVSGNHSIFSTKSSENKSNPLQSSGFLFAKEREENQVKSSTNTSLFENKSLENQSSSSLFSTKPTDNPSSTNVVNTKGADANKPHPSSIFPTNVVGTKSHENTPVTSLFGINKPKPDPLANKGPEMPPITNPLALKNSDSPLKNVLGNQNTNNFGSTGLLLSESQPKSNLYDSKNNPSNLENQPKSNLPKNLGSINESKPTDKTEILKKGDAGKKSSKDKSDTFKTEKVDLTGRPAIFWKQASGDHENLGSGSQKSSIEMKKEKSETSISKMTKSADSKELCKKGVFDSILTNSVQTLEEEISKIKISIKNNLKKSEEFFENNKIKRGVPEMSKQLETYLVDMNHLMKGNGNMIKECKTLLQDIDITGEFTYRFKATTSDLRIKNKVYPSLPNPLLRKKSLNLEEQWKNVNELLHVCEDDLDYWESKRNASSRNKHDAFKWDDVTKTIRSNVKDISLERSKVELLKEHLGKRIEEPFQFNIPKTSIFKMQAVPVEMEKRLHRFMCRRTVKVSPCQKTKQGPPAICGREVESPKSSNKKVEVRPKIDTKPIQPVSMATGVRIVDRYAFKNSAPKALSNQNELEKTAKPNPPLNQLSQQTPNLFSSSTNKNNVPLSTPAFSNLPELPDSVKNVDNVNSKLIPGAPGGNIFSAQSSKPKVNPPKVESKTPEKNVSKQFESTVTPKSNDFSSTLIPESSGKTHSKSPLDKVDANNSATLNRSPSSGAQVTKSNEVPSSVVSINNATTQPVQNLFGPKPTSGGGIFSNVVSTSPSTQATSLFGSTQSTKPNEGRLFGKPSVGDLSISPVTTQLNKPKEGIFTPTVPSSVSSGGLFASPASTDIAAQPSALFGTSSTSQGTGLFGTSTVPQKETGLSCSTVASSTLSTKPASGLFATATFTNSNVTTTSTVTGSTSPLATLSSKPSGGLFPNVTVSTPLTSTPTTGVFSTPVTVSQTTGLFGMSSTKPSGGLFGSSTSPATSFFGTPSTQTSGALFGNTTATTTTAAAGLFGTPTSSTGLFGTSTTKPSGGLFGASTTVSQSTNLFGTPSTQASTGLFANSPVAPATTTSVSGLFSSPTTASQSTGIFGTANKPTEGLFSSGVTSTTQSTGLFGAPMVSTPTVAAAPTVGGLFGGTVPSTNQNSGGLFSSSNTSSQSTGLFGKPQTGGLFASPTSTASTTSTATAPNIFGAPKSTSSQSGLFTNQSASGLFGTQSNTQTPSSGLFGAQSTNKQSGGLFDNSSTTTSPQSFFGKNSPGSSSLFSGSNQQSSNLFGTQQTSSGLFGNANNQMDSSGLSFGSCSISGAAGNQSTNKTNNIFSPVNAGDSTSNKVNLFAQSNQTGSIFNSVSKPNTIFGNNTTTTTQQTSSLFGSRPIFGTANENFMQQPAVQPGNVFQNSVFGNSNASSHMSFGDVATNNENQPFGMNTNGSGGLFQSSTSPAFTQRRM